MDQIDTQQLPGEPFLLADHLGLDLLNTQASINGELVDLWKSDEDVLRWLARCALADAGQPAVPGLLAAARELRGVARALLERRKAGEQGDPAPLNALLQQYQTYPVLEWPASGALRVARRSAGGGPAALLGPVAEAVAALLAEGDFGLVKRCEHPECVLWFYDRTKAHKRRWCSMALCGNRYKAAQFRKRAAR
jgi:predicted RNA-binding Zn ribbon-like protein